MPETQLAPSTRRSGIELLKIAAILLIVISHITQTMHAPNPDIAYSGYLIDLDSATRSLQTFVLILFRHFGVLGNTVFFICSAWFLLESDKFKKKEMVLHAFGNMVRFRCYPLHIGNDHARSASFFHRDKEPFPYGV